MYKVDEATLMFCMTSARLDGGVNNCVADGCMHWRWLPLTTAEPGWKEGIATLIREGLEHKQAAQAMLLPENKKRFKLPSIPYRGYCGLSGKPETEK